MDNQQIDCDELVIKITQQAQIVQQSLQQLDQMIEVLYQHSIKSQCEMISLPSKKLRQLQLQYVSEYKDYILDQMCLQLKLQNNNCCLCKMTFKKEKKLMNHILHKHVDHPFYLCIICLEKFICQTIFKQHICNTHEELTAFKVHDLIIQNIEFGVNYLRKKLK